MFIPTENTAIFLCDILPFRGHKTLKRIIHNNRAKLWWRVVALWYLPYCVFIFIGAAGYALTLLKAPERRINALY
jgi:hypothetical protein